MIDLVKTGEIIAAARKDLNMTQSEMAKKLSVTRQAVSKWERGESLPDIAFIPKIAKLLGMSINDILDYDKNVPHQEGRGFIEELIQKGSYSYAQYLLNADKNRDYQWFFLQSLLFFKNSQPTEAKATLEQSIKNGGSGQAAFELGQSIEQALTQKTAPIEPDKIKWNRILAVGITLFCSLAAIFAVLIFAN